MLELRYYQEEAVSAVFDYLSSKPGNPVVALPTGTGKSIVVAEIVRRVMCACTTARILIVTHVKELVSNNHKELLELWPEAPAGIYSAGLKQKDSSKPITFCGIASIAKRVADFGHIDLVLVDECHLVSPKDSTMYGKAFAVLKAANPYLRVVGLSATPFRLGSGMLTEGGLFSDICIDYCTLDRFNRLVSEGYLSTLIPRKTSVELRADGVAVRGGDYVLKDLQEAVDDCELTTKAVTEAIRLAEGRNSWLTFTTGVEHTRHVVAEMNRQGIPSRAVHSQMDHRDEGTRDENIRLFIEGKIQNLVNYGVLTTGFNHKPVDCIVVFRPTCSPGLWVQILGRGTRPYDYLTERNRTLAESFPYTKYDCLVLDFAGNTRELGPINDPVIPGAKKKKGPGTAPSKLCLNCNTYNHTRATVCCSCGEDFPPPQSKLQDTAASDALVREGTLVEEKDFVVTRCERRKYQPKDPAKAPTIQLTFICGVQRFSEYLSFDSDKPFARKMARDRWRLLEPDTDPPRSTEEAALRLENLRIPQTVTVALKLPYPEVLRYNYLTIDDEDLPF